MKRFIILLLLAISFSQSVNAQLPDLTSQELVNLVQLHENRIHSFQVKYRLTSGEYKDPNSDKKEIVPDVVIDMEYALDIPKGHKYLHEKWINRPDEDEFETKYAFDGQKGTRLVLKLPNDQNRMYGYITANIPDMFNDEALWKPEYSTYGFLGSCDSLSAAIKNDDKAEVTSERYNNEQVYKVTFSTATGKREFTHPDTGKKFVLETRDHFIAWLSPKKSFQPVKIAMLRGNNGEELYACFASDFREVEKDIWLPFRLERPNPRRNRSRIIEVSSFKINEKASVICRLEFPSGTYVRDEIAGLRYKAAPPQNDN